MISEGAGGTPDEVNPEIIRQQLAKLLTSQEFRDSEKQKAFFAFTFDAYLKGATGNIKEYTIAVEVFQQPPSYDSSKNSAVRVAANRLRANLKHYYDTEGSDDPVLVEYPKGGYAPHFTVRAQAPGNALLEQPIVVTVPQDGVPGPGDAPRREPENLIPVPTVLVPRRFAKRLAVSLVPLFCVALCIGFATHVYPPLPSIGAFRPITHDGQAKFGPLMLAHSKIYFRTKTHAINSAEAERGSLEVVTTPMPDLGIRLLAVNPRTGDFLISGNQDDAMQTWYWRPGMSSQPLHRDVPDAAAFSPDGKNLAFLNAPNGRLDLLDSTRLTTRRSMAIATEVTRWISYSPDGTKLRFDVFDHATDQTSIWELKDHDGKAHELYGDAGPEHPRSFCCGSWSPNGSWFVFSGGPEDSGGDLWVTQDSPRALANASRPIQLTKGPLRLCWPAVAENGRSIFAIGSNRHLEAVRWDLHSKNITAFLEGRSAIAVNFSPNGQQVAYADQWDSTIWRSRPDGSEAVQLTLPPMEAYEPHWSPDGKRIAFMGRLPGHHWRAYVMGEDGRELRAVLEDENEQGVPTWSGDGRYLVFGDRLYQRPHEQMRIHVWDSRTGQLADLPGSDGRWTARWSPDGRYIAAQSWNFQDLYLYELKTRVWRKLVTLSDIDCLNWSGDGKYLYFWVRRTGPDSCYRFAISSQKIEKLLTATDYPEVSTEYLGVAPDGSLILDRIVNTQDIYAIELRWPWWWWR